jgi:hypothetical protein
MQPPKGWTDHELTLEWLQKIFIPETYIEGQFRLLIVDGHGSHVSDDFQEIRKTFNIIDDSTPEDEEQIRRENEWSEDR